MGISWRDDLAIGDEKIDSQHRELIERFDNLLSACRNGEGKQELARLLDFLDQYVILHFGEEESRQRLVGYPAYPGHRVQHKDFIEKISQLKSRIASDGEIQLDHLLETNSMLLDWLVNHISTSDKALGEFILKNS